MASSGRAEDGGLTTEDGGLTPRAETSPAAPEGSDGARDRLLWTRDLTKSYSTAAGELHVLRGIDIEVHPAEIVAITGESGTGKSTLLHLLGGLDRPTAGSIYYNARNIFALGDAELAAFRNRTVGFVFQFHHLLPEFNALENVAMPALIGGLPLARATPRARVLLDTLGIADRADHRPSQLSGGEQQRVAVARALMNEPTIVLMDEPTGNLDTRTAEALHDEIVRLCEEHGQTFVVVTHNPALAERAHRVLHLEDGMLQAVHS
jgi:lipoprotein-releasing system ATP-binding protein